MVFVKNISPGIFNNDNATRKFLNLEFVEILQQTKTKCQNIKFRLHLLGLPIIRLNDSMRMNDSLGCIASDDDRK